MKILTESMIESKNFQRFSYPKDMDKEMIDLMDVLNNIPGCRTLYCCQGHGYGDWYFVANCCHLVPYNAIKNFFETKQKTNPLIEICENSVGYFEDQEVPEYQITIYDKTFDSLSLDNRKAAYKDMCEHFLKLVPRKHWSGISKIRKSHK